MFRAEDWVEESKGERGLPGVQEQCPSTTNFLPAAAQHNSQLLKRCFTLELFGLDSDTQN